MKEPGPSNADGMRVTVIGARSSGIAAALLMQERGAEVFVSDAGPVGAPERLELEEHGIGWEQDGHSSRVFDAGLCIVSPGVPPDVPVMKDMRRRGIDIVSEIEAASWFCEARMIAVTGTDGKTTTVSLITAICLEYAAESGFRVEVAGNIGVPFSSVVGGLERRDIVVVEISSYQLEACRTFHPDVAVITNITPDHLDRYGGSMEAYARAKYRIFAGQQCDDTLVVNADDPMLLERFRSFSLSGGPRLAAFGCDGMNARELGSSGAVLENGRIILFSDAEPDVMVISERELLKRGFAGRHNVSNALAASAAAAAAGIPAGPVRRALAAFRGVEHRQEYVCERNGVTCINDSKATNLQALQKALEAVTGRVVLIAGGRDKGGDYSMLRELVEEKVAGMVVIGEARGLFREAYGDLVPVMEAVSLHEAVSKGVDAALPGMTLLFSPGCSSFDMFDNFEERGSMFKRILREVAA